jgi:hypothetical protein
VIVAYERDGKPLGEFRIVMPATAWRAQRPRDVVSINIK